MSAPAHPAGDVRAPGRALEAALARARTAGEDVAAALDVARALGPELPLPAGGDTAGRWAALSALGRADLTVARVVEAHADALAILAESGREVTAEQRTWGVFAAEGGDRPLTAEPVDGGVALTGVKPWCSLAGELDAALVTARTGDTRGLFAVDLRRPDVHVAPAGQWAARGLRTVTSVPVTFDATPAVPVGGPGWYLRRPGFAWGGIGVAACWLGGAYGVADALFVAGVSRELDDLHTGAVDVALHAAQCVLDDAARAVDAGTSDPERLALRVRAVVAGCVEDVLRHVGHALGPAPLAFDAAHAARVADLTLYVRQHHGERDLAALGRLVGTAR